jgi:hypothetical protein
MGFRDGAGGLFVGLGAGDGQPRPAILSPTGFRPVYALADQPVVEKGASPLQYPPILEAVAVRLQCINLQFLRGFDRISTAC